MQAAIDQPIPTRSVVPGSSWRIFCFCIIPCLWFYCLFVCFRIFWFKFINNCILSVNETIWPELQYIQCDQFKKLMQKIPQQRIPTYYALPNFCSVFHFITLPFLNISNNILKVLILGIKEVHSNLYYTVPQVQGNVFWHLSSI